jgi:regulator of replication initiation timing
MPQALTVDEIETRARNRTLHRVDVRAYEAGLLAIIEENKRLRAEVEDLRKGRKRKGTSDGAAIPDVAAARQDDDSAAGD